MHQKILHIWSGCITFPDDALQLLLIMDYIFDWARDIYRPSILRQIRALSTDHVALNDHDSDIFSLKDVIPSWIPDPEVPCDDLNLVELDSSFNDDTSSSILRLDANHGLVRRVGDVESRLLGLFINADNASTLLASDETPLTSLRTARKILTAVAEGYFELSSECLLNSLEDQWVGHLDYLSESSIRPSTVYVKVTVTHYLNSQWDLVRELNYIALTEGGLGVLLQHAKLKGLPMRIAASRHGQKGKESDLEKICSDLLRASTTQCLLACLHKEVVALHDVMIRGSGMEEQLSLKTADPPSAQPSESSIREIVLAIYRKNKVGRREPSETFLRRASRTTNNSNEGHSKLLALSLDRHGPLQQPEPGKVLVYGKSPPQTWPERPSPCLCLYVLDDKQDMDSKAIADALFSFLASCKWVYYARREEKQLVTNIFKKDLWPLTDGLISSTEELRHSAFQTYTFTTERLLLSWVTAIAPELQSVLDRDIAKAVESVPRLDVVRTLSSSSERRFAGREPASLSSA